VHRTTRGMTFLFFENGARSIAKSAVIRDLLGRRLRQQDGVDPAHDEAPAHGGDGVEHRPFPDADAALSRRRVSCRRGGRGAFQDRANLAGEIHLAIGLLQQLTARIDAAPIVARAVAVARCVKDRDAGMAA